MKKQTSKIIVGVLLSISIIFGSLVASTVITPKQADAQQAVMDFLTEVWGGLTTAATTVSQYLQTEMQLEDSIIKDIAIGIAKQILQQLTLSVVDWINHGFNGSPAFVSNPAQYFQNLGDDIAGNFLQQNGDLKFLCSPFSLNVRIALALQMTNINAQKYTCTLSSAIQNATNAVNGASISGFIDKGDFSQGGWPGFISLTTQPQNTAGGAFLQAESDLTKKINAKINQKTNELAQGLGFMSSETCNYSQTSDTGSVTNLTKSEFDTINASNNEENDANLNEVCQTTTPGSVISSVLNKHLGVPTDELLLAQDLNAIISAAFSALVLQVFNGGLGSVSATPSSSGGATYLQTLASQSAAQLQALQASSIQQLAPHLSDAMAYKANIDTSLGIADAAETNIDTSVTCWSQFPATSTKYLLAQSNIAQLQLTKATSVAPMIASLTTQDTSASSSIQGILSIENSINSAQSSTDLSASSQQITTLLTGNTLITAPDVQSAADQINATTASTTPINDASSASLQQCQYNISTYGL